MQGYLLLSLFLLLINCMGTSSSKSKMASIQWTEMEPGPHRATLTEQAWGVRSEGTTEHEVTFHIHALGKEKLEQILKAVSDPKSPKYGQHLSKEEVDRITKNSEAEESIHEYLHELGARIVKESNSAVTAVAPLSVWERAFNTEFFVVNHNDKTYNRAHKYYLPSSVAPHVDMVSNTIHVPIAIHHGPVIAGGPKRKIATVGQP